MVHFSQSAAEQRLHYYYGDVALGEFVVHIFSRRVGVLPVLIVHLNLHEVEFHGLLIEHIVEKFLRAVERPAEIFDAAGFALLDEKIEHAIIDVALTIVLEFAYGVQ